MDDFAYLFRDSTHAWLVGNGDRRFAAYEAYYRSARDSAGSEFDLEFCNEEFVKAGQRRVFRIARVISHPSVAKFGIACGVIWCAGQIVPRLAMENAKGTGLALAAAFFALRIFHRKRRG